MSRLLICNHAGTVIAEIQAKVARSWLLNDVGRAEFELSIFDSKCQREFLEFGNLVYIEHAKLPAWAGVIDTPRRWSGNSVQATAYSGAKILSYRRGPQQVKVSGDGGEIFARILELANAEGDTLIRAGTIWSNGQAREETLDLTRLLDEIKRVAKRCKNDFDIVPAMGRDNLLRFDANWYEHVGEDSNLLLEEGHNLRADDPLLVEQGEIINDLIGYGAGTTTDNRKTERQVDEESIAQYGLRQAAMSFDGDSEQDTLAKNVEAELGRRSNPRRTVRASVPDIGLAWGRLRIGNQVTVWLKRAGFGLSERLRIVGMAIDAEETAVELTLDEEL